MGGQRQQYLDYSSRGHAGQSIRRWMNEWKKERTTWERERELRKEMREDEDEGVLPPHDDDDDARLCQQFIIYSCSHWVFLSFKLN